MKKYNRTESGRSMVEMVGVLSVMGLITAGAFVLVGNGQRSQKISRTDDEVANIAANVRTLFAESSDFSKLPSTLDKGTKLLTALSLPTSTPFGGTYSVTSGKDKTTFVVVISDLSETNCKVLENRGWSDAKGVSCEKTTLSVTFGK